MYETNKGGYKTKMPHADTRVSQNLSANMLFVIELGKDENKLKRTHFYAVCKHKYLPTTNKTSNLLYF